MAKANGTTHGLEDWQHVVPLPHAVNGLEPPQLTKVSTTREIEFALLSDGRMMDLGRCTGRAQGLEFLVWDHGQICRTSYLEHENERLIVPRLDSSIISALRLPGEAKTCPPVRELSLQLMEAIGTYFDLSAQDIVLLATFILSTWFADRLPVAPYLSVCGPPDSGQAKLLQFLHCLCRRAIHVGHVTPSSVYRLSAQVRPTWLIDEPDFNNRYLASLLRAGHQRGSYVLSQNKAFENFGPKVIVSRTPLNDIAIASNTVHIVMSPSGRDLPSLDPYAQQTVADTFQPMLQMFRFVNYKVVSGSQHPLLLKLPVTLQDTARALAAPLLGNEELLERLAEILESQARFVQFDRFGDPEWVVMLALYALCHEFHGDLYLARVTEESNRMLRESGEGKPYSSHKVGRIMRRSLGFDAGRRGEGYRIELSLEIRRKIHSHAKAMGIKRGDILHPSSVESGVAGPACHLCTEFDLNKDHEGRELRDFDHPDFLAPLVTDPACKSD
jgi:hypothetical protein